MTDPLWSLAINAVSQSVTAVAILAGGTVGYFRYLRGRISHAKLDIDVGLELCALPSGAAAVKVTAAIKNDGTCRVAFPADSVQQIQLAACYPSPWARACESYSPPVWSTYYAEPFQPEGEVLTELEPGQRTSRQLLVPAIATPTPVAYRARLYVEGRPHLLWRYRDHSPWSTERVIEGKTHG